MDDAPRSERELRDYLLGRSDGAAADPEYSEMLEAIEEELVDDYVQNALSDEERVAFERNYLVNSGRRAKVEFAAALRQSALRGRRRRSRYAMPAVAFAAMFLCFAWYAAVGSIARVDLHPGRARSPDDSSVGIPWYARAVELHLSTAMAARDCSVAVHPTGSARIVFSSGGAHAERGAAVVRVPAGLIREGDYHIELSCLTGVPLSYFLVTGR